MNGTRLHGALARICSPQTLERVVEPIFSDMAAEPARPRWRGYLDLVRALLVHALLSVPQRAAHAGPSHPSVLGHVLLVSMVVGGLSALLLTTVPVLITFGRGRATEGLMLLRVPSLLTITLAAALFVALPLVLRGRVLTRQLAARTMALSLGHVALTLLLVGWVAPAANQWYRVNMSGNPHITRGINEKTLGQVRRELALFQRYQPGVPSTRRDEYSYHSRLALSGMPIAVMLLALSLTATAVAQRRPYVIGGLAMVGYVVLLLFSVRSTESLATRAATVPAAALAWLPLIGMMLAGALAFTLRCPRRSPAPGQ